MLIPLVALLVLSAAVSFACDRADPGLLAGRTMVTGMVTEHCRDCHMRSVSPDVPEALAVFDLDNPEWLAGMPSKSWCAFLSRLLPYADSTKDRELRATIDAELARRHRARQSQVSDQQVDTIGRLCPSIYRPKSS